MEKLQFKSSNGLNLVADFYKGNKQSLVIMAHGFTGDRHEWGNFDIAAQAFNNRGYNIFNFDFSGSGESQDAPLTISQWESDMAGALQYTEDQGFRDIAIVGLSLGGLIALTFWKHARTLVLWAPVTNSQDRLDRDFTPDQIQELESGGIITYMLPKGARENVVIPKQQFEERAAIDQAKVMAGIDIPVLIIHGDKDEDVPLSDSQSAITYLSSASKLEVLPGASHEIKNQLNSIIGLSKNWLERHLR